MDQKIIVITAPSGSGKTTLVKRLLTACPQLAFSISACTRNPRLGEIDGKDYYFLSENRFVELVEEKAFIEWEMVYTGKYYGTLKTELNRIWDNAQCPLVDIDVKGALSIKETYPDNILTIFIKAPSIDELRARLTKRGTETPQTLEERVEKAEFELGFAEHFDRILINDDLEAATTELVAVVKEYIGS